MAATSTTTLLQTMEWAKKFNFGRRSAIGDFLEPALTSANLVMQTILGPPFVWRWNKGDANFTTTDPNSLWQANHTFALGESIFDSNGNRQTVTDIGAVPHQSGAIAPTWSHPYDLVTSTTDGNLTWRADYPNEYPLVIQDLGFIDDITVLDVKANPSTWYEFENKMSLSIDNKFARPRFISAHTDDGNGTVAIRIMPAANAAYPVNIHYMKSAPQFTSLNQTWGPIPDYMSYIYSWGFLAMMWAFADDPRFPLANQKFIAHLVGAQSGLSETERNIFLNNWNAISGNQIALQTQGIQARAT